MNLKPQVYLMCGVPGAGKSTWVEEHLDENTDVWCSRDKIRFSLINDNDEYFSKEAEVIEKWIADIQNNINIGKNVYIDATHINAKSRKLTLSKLDLTNAELNAVYFATPLNICLKRNNLRQGRERVPEDVIKDMWNHFSPPSFSEGFNKIIKILS